MRFVSCLVAVAAISASMACTGDDQPVAAKPETPIGFRFEAVGLRSFASFGWAGTQHNILVPDGTPFSVKVDSCQGSDGPCLFHGPVQLPGDLQRQRCLNKMSVQCTSDADCAAFPSAGAGSCVFIYDPPTTEPLPTFVTGGQTLGACGWTYIPLVNETGQPGIVGSIDQTSGEVILQRLLLNLSLNGPGGQTFGGCEVCVGDDVANDGKKNGKCQTPTLAAGFTTEHSLDDGQPCDINRQSNVAGLNTEGYSMDCSPNFVPFPLAFPTPIGGAFSTADVEMTAATGPACTFGGSSGKCFCGVCADDGVTGCHTSAECRPGVACGLALPSTCMPTADGVCTKDVPLAGGMVGLVGTRANDCSGVCDWDEETGHGSCTSTTGQTIACYPGGNDAVIRVKGSHARGQEGTFVVDTANVACDGATPSAAANRQIGLPGLIFQKRGFRVIPQFNAGK